VGFPFLGLCIGPAVWAERTCGAVGCWLAGRRGVGVVEDVGRWGHVGCVVVCVGGGALRVRQSLWIGIVQISYYIYYILGLYLLWR
jgi:hypothetical protein